MSAAPVLAATTAGGTAHALSWPRPVDAIGTRVRTACGRRITVATLDARTDGVRVDCRQCVTHTVYHGPAVPDGGTDAHATFPERDDRGRPTVAILTTGGTR
jgi:hypothetical protein